MRVAVVVERLSRYGGVESRTLALVKCLLDLGHEVTVYGNRWDDAVSACGAKFRRVPMLTLGRSSKPLSFAIFCSMLIRRGKYDIVHTQARIFSYDVMTMGVGCHKAYLEAMGIDYKTSPDWLFQRTMLYIERCMFRPGAYRRLIANSRMCKRDVSSHYGVSLDDISVVRNGVDSVRFSPVQVARHRESTRRNLGVSDDDRVVLYVGTGFKRKGLDTLVKSVGTLENNERVKILVVGSGNREEYERLAIECGIGGQIVWAGQSSDVAHQYAASDVFVLPTRYDPFANSTMEALAAGVPVITTNKNGVSEILEDGRNGFVFSAGDHLGLGSRLASVLSDPVLAARIGSAGRETVCSMTWQRTAEETVCVYESLP